MATSVRSWQQDAERQFLEGMRAQYTEEGFAFAIDPAPEQLPNFLGGYRPDAIALKPGSNIAIEVRHRLSPAARRPLQDIRRLFEGHPDWHLIVANMGSDPLQSLFIAAASPAAIRDRTADVRALLAQRQRRAAFIMAWSLLEAALHRLDGQSDGRPQTPGTVVQTLAMLGYLDPATERRMGALIELRNRIVHGDLDAEPTAENVELVLSAISETLEPSAA